MIAGMIRPHSTCSDWNIALITYEGQALNVYVRPEAWDDVWSKVVPGSVRNLICKPVSKENMFLFQIVTFDGAVPNMPGPLKVQAISDPKINEVTHTLVKTELPASDTHNWLVSPSILKILIL